jgi:hypothetical protein
MELWAGDVLHLGKTVTFRRPGFQVGSSQCGLGVAHCSSGAIWPLRVIVSSSSRRRGRRRRRRRGRRKSMCSSSRRRGRGRGKPRAAAATAETRRRKSTCSSSRRGKRRGSTSSSSGRRRRRRGSHAAGIGRSEGSCCAQGSVCNRQASSQSKFLCIEQFAIILHWLDACLPVIH